MKLTGFMVVIIAALLFLIPTMRTEQKQFQEIQAQEEAPIEQIRDQANTYKITYRSQSPKEEPIVDIIWMKKAAEVAANAGIPYFNVLSRKIYSEFSDEFKIQLSVVEGTIQLDNDPMRAEYDAQEIESLVLTDQVD
jgi:competence protein ComGC